MSHSINHRKKLIGSRKTLSSRSSSCSAGTNHHHLCLPDTGIKPLLSGFLCCTVLLFLFLFLPLFSAGAFLENQYCQQLIQQRSHCRFTILSLYAQDEEDERDITPDPVFFPIKNSGKILLSFHQNSSQVRHLSNCILYHTVCLLTTGNNHPLFYLNSQSLFIRYVFGTLRPVRAGPENYC